MSDIMEIESSTNLETFSNHSTQVPWIEKYRPQTFEDIVGNRELVERIEHFAVNGNIPHILLCGTPGIGKTTTIQCMARISLGDAFKDGVLELNASNERGINIIRNKVKMFAKNRVTLPMGRHKIIILDEVDSLTDGSQQALRRIMEVYSNTTRFALACNQSDKIVEPIQSRCAVLRFTRLSDAEILARIIKICEWEKIETTKEGLETIIYTAQGDLRQAINNLQSTYNGFRKITYENVLKICDEPNPLMISDMLKHCESSNLSEALKILLRFWSMGYSSDDIVKNIFRVLKRMDLPEHMLMAFVKEIGLCHVKIAEGVNSIMQLTNLLGNLCKVAQTIRSK